MRLISFGLSLLLAVISAHAVAGALDNDIAVAQLRHANLDNAEQHAASAQGQAETRRRDFELPSAETYIQPGLDASPAEIHRRQGKLSAEERRALRRHIDEAGHLLYPPRR